MTITSKRTYTSPQAEEAPHQNEHFVLFYKTDEFLVDASSEFIGTGLDGGDACIILVTKAHQEQLEERLRARGLDLAMARSEGTYLALDADETLSQFMRDELPDPERFAEVVGGIITRAAQSRPHLRLYGEMVAQLWAQGKQAAAICLEKLWSDLPGKTHPFSLFCAYPMHSFAGKAYEERFTEICKQHTQVIPDESYSLLSGQDERLQAITLLQQKANTLEVEIAKRKAVEERLRVTENHYRRLAAIVESSDDAILSKNLEGIITSWNGGAERIYGYSAQEIVGQPVTRLFLPDQQDEFTHIMARIRRGERIDHYETTRVRKDGVFLTVSITVSPIKDSNGTIIGASAIARDITEHKQLEARLQELDKRKDEFISMASHELKTPLTSLKGFLSLLQRRVSIREDEKALHYLHRMDTQVNKLTKLINDLLDLSKMQTGQLAYRKERFELDALVQEIMENVQETTQTHHVQLEGQSQAQVFGDRDRIGQVLINLLTNAIKYSPQADTVLIRVTRDNNTVLVSVQDFGIGIASEYQQKIFERFYQVTDVEEKTYPGLGIGLYISCEIVKRHGGQMWVESEKSKGATFFMTLPLLKGHTPL